MELAHIERWSSGTRTGDLAELSALEDDSALIPLVTSTRENCLGADCPQVAHCHVNHARRSAMAADVVVINHHLFFADIQVRESGVAELLPTVTTVVFDEAHVLNDVGVQFLANQWSTTEIAHLIRDLSLHGSQMALATSNWREGLANANQCVADLRAAFVTGSSGRIAWTGTAPLGVDVSIWVKRLSELAMGLQRLDGLLEEAQESFPVLRPLQLRSRSLAEKVAEFNKEAPPGAVRWAECGEGVRLFQAPLSIANAMQQLINRPSEEGLSKKLAWIFTSATLGHDASLSWFVNSCGLNEASVVRVQSPFDYVRQAVVYVPSHLPKPSDPDHSESVASLVAHSAEILGGRTLVLTTTLRAMRHIGESLRRQQGGVAEMDILVQGQHSKGELIKRFCRTPVGSQRGSILVACASFWEGIDIPGDALQMVVIDKLPFAPPDDPLVEARSRILLASGKKPFHHLHVPMASVALKQGAGRLIRSETDRGVLVICDVRLIRSSYGKRMLAALPTMKVANSHAQFTQALRALTKTSTMDAWTDLCFGPEI
jgi:ATP-dependent DNA helicase DinG